MQQEQKPLVTSIAAGVLVVIVGFVVIGRWYQRTPDVQPSTDTTVAGVALTVMSISSSTASTTIRGEYPRFTTIPALNAEVERYVQTSLTEFARTTVADREARRELQASGETVTDIDYIFDLRWEPTQINERYVSFLLRVSAYEGGANMRLDTIAFNWDVVANKPVSLVSLFDNDPGYLDRIAVFTRQALAFQLEGATSEEFLDAGTAPVLDNFARFTFTDDAVRFVFSKYAVAPGAAGEPEVVMPRTATTGL